MIKTRTIAWVAAAAVMAACDSPLDTNPTASIDAETALSTPRGIELGLNGAYRSLQPGNLYGVNLMVYPDMYADNLDFTGTFQTDREVAQRNINATNGAVLSMWADMYDGINRTNNILDAIPNVGALSSSEAAQYRGEALFIRSLHYSLLAGYFGDVPIVTEPSRGVGEESLVARDPVADVYAMIIADLEESATLLAPGHVAGRATADAANALLARVYLETGAYAQARDKATLLIESGEYSLPADYATVFRTNNSSESIFELQYSINNSNNQAFWFYTPDLGGRWGYSPTADLYAAFEPGDERLDVTIGIDAGDRYGNKYEKIENGDDNIVVLRLAEMYLIRAEANARLNAAPAVVRADINEVRNRAGLPDLPTTVDTQQELFDAILQERRVELAFEGLRFFDLRRLGVATTLLQIPATHLLWPIPQAERDVNTALTQNDGY
ncbi:MAG TPA: RagB/SusD family nutrient uptake outer membrane protein [Longimicrobiales bacterium]|nr:RagB/SusD family nutrient uptake outer membrane protein [Longimicrobiales bacterium]